MKGTIYSTFKYAKGLTAHSRYTFYHYVHFPVTLVLQPPQEHRKKKKNWKSIYILQEQHYKKAVL